MATVYRLSRSDSTRCWRRIFTEQQFDLGPEFEVVICKMLRKVLPQIKLQRDKLCDHTCHPKSTQSTALVTSMCQKSKNS